MKKKIVILSSTPIALYSGIRGPLLSPFFETTANIVKLINAGIDVREYIADDNLVKLSLSNCTANNESNKKVTKTVKITEPVTKEEKKDNVELMNDVTTTINDKTSTPSQPHYTQKSYEGGKKKNHNKNFINKKSDEVAE